MSKYAQLEDHLHSLTSAEVVMSYAQIEKLLGGKLPGSAYGRTKRQWWANTRTHSQALAWLNANRKAKLHAASNQVTFTKSDGGSSTSKYEATGLKIDKSLLEPAAVRLLEDIAEDRATDLAGAIALMVNEAARKRRKATLDWFAETTIHSPLSSVELIRAERDAR